MQPSSCCGVLKHADFAILNPGTDKPQKLVVGQVYTSRIILSRAIEAIGEILASKHRA